MGHMLLDPQSADLPRFHGIISDPPWKFLLRSDRGGRKSAQAHYDCMTLDDIKSLPVQKLAADDCLLWLWTTGPFLRIAMDVLDAWGFTYKTSGHWNKITKNGKPGFGTGYWVRTSSEPYIIATRGRPKIYSRSERSSFDGPLREHSRKPLEGIQQFCRMTIPPRLEMFSREHHDGIDAVWGNQTGLFGGTGAPRKLLLPGELGGSPGANLSAGARADQSEGARCQ